MFIKIDIKSKVLSADDETFHIFEDERKYYLLKGRTILPLKEGYSFMSKTYDINFSLVESPKTRPEKITPFETLQKKEEFYPPSEEVPNLHFLQEVDPYQDKKPQKTFADFFKG